MKNVPKLRFKDENGRDFPAWEKKELGDTLSIFSGYAFSSGDAQSNGVKWLKIADVGIQQMTPNNPSYLPFALKEIHKNYLVYKNDYVIALTRPILNGKLKIAKIDQIYNESLINQRVGKLTSNQNIDFIYFILQLENTVSEIANTISGTDPPNLSLKEIKNIKFFIPKEEKEQTKIANFLTAIDDRITQLTQKVDGLEQYKKAVMQQIFSQKLRFKDEKGRAFGAWEEKRLGDVATRVKRKNIEDNKNVLTISAQQGLINQEEFFNKSVSAKDVTNYYLLHKGEFAYNKSYSNGYPMGAIKCLNRYDKGVVSTLYICFKLNDGNINSFFEHYFESGKHNTEIEKVAQEGARNHGLLNIGLDDFFSISLSVPSRAEQAKIAGFLGAVDEKLAQAKAKLDAVKQYKQGLLQQMFV
jgi:type I restriction enzyme S subunit